ncbi:MAG: YfhO family protein [Candidatus Moranbacteria bacterium]|nr:YfhO family protein [Candidatus Moranbacteria bacterium]
MRFSVFLFFFVVLGLLVTIETLPQTLPTNELLSQSSRGNGTDYLKGSLDSRMAIFSFVPYLLGENNNFFGRDISTDFSYNEVYFYVGISSLMLSIFALLMLKKTREVIAAVIFIWIFLLFGFMENNHLFPSNTPLVTYFRDWQRSVFLFAFGIAMLAGIFIERIKECSFKNMKTGFLFVFAPVMYMYLLATLNGGKVAKKLDFYIAYHYIKNYQYFSVIEAIALNLIFTLAIIFIVRRVSPSVFDKILSPIKFMIIGLVFFDLFYFSYDVTALRLQDTSNFKLAVAPGEFRNERVILGNLNILGAESLYYGNWSPLGTSQLKESKYVDFYGKLGLDLRGVTSSILETPKDLGVLKDAGIVAVAQYGGTTLLNNSKLDLIKNELNGYYVKKNEGDIVMQINNPEDSVVGTYLRYSPYWNVRVDGKEVKISKNGIFFDFPLRQGNHFVEIHYYPRTFFQGLMLSLVLGVISIGAYFLFKKKLSEKMLK